MENKITFILVISSLNLLFILSNYIIQTFAHLKLRRNTKNRKTTVISRRFHHHTCIIGNKRIFFNGNLTALKDNINSRQSIYEHTLSILHTFMRMLKSMNHPHIYLAIFRCWLSYQLKCHFTAGDISSSLSLLTFLFPL